MLISNIIEDHKGNSAILIISFTFILMVTCVAPSMIIVGIYVESKIGFFNAY